MTGLSSPDLVPHAFDALGPLQVVVFGIGYFGLLYFGVGGLAWVLTRRVLPAWGWGRVLDPRPLMPGQLRRELRESSISVLIFGIGLLLPWGLLRLGWARLAVEPTALRVLVE